MATLADALKDRKGFPDAQEITLGDGLKITLGELRQYQEATGQDVAKQLAAEQQKLATDREEVARAQSAIVEAYTKLQKEAQSATRVEATPGADWTKDPFFAPVADYLKNNVESSITKQAQQIEQFQKALGLGVKYIVDKFSQMEYSQLPEDFRKETPYDAAVRSATEKKFLDSGGVPDIRKVYDEWRGPREKKAEMDKLREEIRDEERSKAMQSALPRPGGLPSMAAQADPNAPKSMKESFARLREDPEFMRLVYQGGGTA